MCIDDIDVHRWHTCGGLLISNKGGGLTQTELKAGMLLVNGQMIIRKAGSRMVFEGTICKEFHAVRKLLVSQYHRI